MGPQWACPHGWKGAVGCGAETCQEVKRYARDLERANIVAWLRQNNDLKRCYGLADAIERGDHLTQSRSGVTRKE